MSLRQFRLKSPILTLLACTLAFALADTRTTAAQESAATPPVATPRIVARVDEDQLTTIKGSVHPLARAKYDQGAVSPDLAMGDLILVLKRSPEQQAAFDNFVASQYEPSSPNFHKWLQPAQVGEKFGVAQSDIDTISNWLRNHNFSVDEVTRDRMSIRFSGTAAMVQSAFHTQIHNLNVNGEKHIANMTDPQIPSALTTVVVGVKAFHNFFAKPYHRMGGTVTRNSETGKWQRLTAAPRPGHSNTLAGKSGNGAAPQLSEPRPLFSTTDSSNDVVEDVTPFDFATIYNVQPLWNASTPIDGTGQTIAIAGTSKINPTDLATFRSTFGLKAIHSFTQKVANNTDPGQCLLTTGTCTVSDLVEPLLQAPTSCWWLRDQTQQRPTRYTLPKITSCKIRPPQS
jgi:hypothetical protein